MYNFTIFKLINYSRNYFLYKINFTIIILMSIWKTFSYNKILTKNILLPIPSIISYLWNFGSLLGICLILQILTGFFLTFHYSNDISLAFFRVSHIIRDVNYGWLIRILHANGASLFFFLIYIHIGRGLYYSSFKAKIAWASGILILFLLIATAFLGYVLPWGQISYWGATVITNILRAIPYIGNNLTLWIWGNFSVRNATLTRFYSIHFILPFIIIILIITHLIFIHESISSNPLGTPKNFEIIPFHPFFIWKDILGILILFIGFLLIVFQFPFIFFDAENFIPANPLSTPIHIQPEWYFLFAYSILRSIPRKFGGVIAIFLRIMILLYLPFSCKNYFSPIYFYPWIKLSFWILINLFLLLTYLGACPVEEPYSSLRQIITILYFLNFLTIPILTINLK